MKEVKETFDYENPLTHYKYLIRLYYETGDKERECLVYIIIPATETAEELEEFIGSFKYNDEVEKIAVIERGKMLAYNHRFMIK